jgi:hypothetical protein
MVRTQIYLTEEEREALQSIAQETGRTQSELIREAIDGLIERYPRKDRLSLLRQACGMWRDRDDLPGLIRQLRKEVDQRVQR